MVQKSFFQKVWKIALSQNQKKKQRANSLVTSFLSIQSLIFNFLGGLEQCSNGVATSLRIPNIIGKGPQKRNVVAGPDMQTKVVEFYTVKAATAIFWQARPPQWRPHHQCRTKILTLETTIFGLKMMVTSGLDFFILKFTKPFQR